MTGQAAWPEDRLSGSSSRASERLPQLDEGPILFHRRVAAGTVGRKGRELLTHTVGSNVLR
jgi:hypothetical protein